MKIRSPSWGDIKKERVSVFAFLGIVVVLLLVNFLWLSPLMSEKGDLENRLRQQEELVRKYEEKLKQAQEIRNNLTKKEKELKEMQKRLFRGNDPYQLAASLGDILSAKGGPKLDMKTYQVLANKEYGLYQEVHLRFNFMTTVEGLYSFLQRVRDSETAILVQEINIQKIQRKTGPDLVVNVILAALMEKGEKS
jgi:DNA repair exonuclease SbcCD ATPase subunit